MSVAESMVILGPIDQLGCASACSEVTAARSAALRPRKGPPDPVSSSSSSAASPPPLPATPALAPPPAMHWNSALCSLSTGRIGEPLRRAASRTNGPPATMLSLLASASVAPASSVAMVARSPAAPTTPFRTISGAPSAAARSAATEMSSRIPASPACTASSGASAAARAAASASCRHTSRTPCASACEATPAASRPAARPTRRSPGTAGSTSSAWRPIEPGRAEDEQVSGGGVGHGRKGTMPALRGAAAGAGRRSRCRTPACAGWRTRAPRAPEGTQAPHTRR